MGPIFVTARWAEYEDGAHAGGFLVGMGGQVGGYVAVGESWGLALGG